MLFIQDKYLLKALKRFVFANTIMKSMRKCFDSFDTVWRITISELFDKPLEPCRLSQPGAGRPRDKYHWTKENIWDWPVLNRSCSRSCCHYLKRKVLFFEWHTCRFIDFTWALCNTINFIPARFGHWSAEIIASLEMFLVKIDPAMSHWQQRNNEVYYTTEELRREKHFITLNIKCNYYHISM